QLASKIHIFRAVSRSVYVRHIRNHQLVALRSDVQSLLQQIHHWCGHVVHAYLLGGKPYSRILFRIVRRLTPSISAVRVRFPPVLCRVASNKLRSTSRIDVPGRAVSLETQGSPRERSVPESSARRHSGPISSPSLKVTTLRMKLPSSRTLPGQEWACRPLTNSECNNGVCLPASFACFRAKKSANIGISSRRSRRGGIDRGITFN